MKKLTKFLALCLIVVLLMSSLVVAEDNTEKEESFFVSIWSAFTSVFSSSSNNIGGKAIAIDFDDKAPVTCKNIRSYVNEGFFDGLIFHRVIPGFVIQGGGFEPGMKKKQTHPPIMNEADNGEKNLRGTLSMARTQDIFSGTSQFFINLVDNASLDHRGKTPSGYGYAVFGKVTQGMDVVDKIAATPTGQKGRFRDIPVEDVVILKVSEKK